VPAWDAQWERVTGGGDALPTDAQVIGAIWRAVPA
jgi:hypothetical protein